MIYNFSKPNPTVRTPVHVAANASHMINITGALFNYCWGESSPLYQEYDVASNTNQQEEYIVEETEVLNKKGRDDLNDLYENNQKFRGEIINFVGDETELGNEKILDKRYKHNTFIKLVIETGLIGIIASYK